MRKVVPSWWTARQAAGTDLDEPRILERTGRTVARIRAPVKIRGSIRVGADRRSTTSSPMATPFRPGRKPAW
ncbi:MAG: hypothetical protein J2P48_23420, partial [Alphaproteobacteria bacterium]|nr:hypothetical protein [Alphaproteobacteria bacterium]